MREDERERGVNRERIHQCCNLSRVLPSFFTQSDSARRHRVTRSSSKRKSDPYTQAVSLARHLYMLDGYKKSEVAGKLADM